MTTFTKERVQWLHDVATELASMKLKMTMKPDEVLQLTTALLASMNAEPCEKEAFRPVGVMSEKAFLRLESAESRFIALWPRPGIYLPRKRPVDGVIVYARIAGGTVEGSE